MLYLLLSLRYVAIVNPVAYGWVMEHSFAPSSYSQYISQFTSKERAARNWDVCKDGKLLVPLDELAEFWNRRKYVVYR